MVEGSPALSGKRGCRRTEGQPVQRTVLAAVWRRSGQWRGEIRTCSSNKRKGPAMIELEDRGAVTTLRMVRGKGNALHIDLVAALLDALDRFEGSPARAGIIT